MKKLKCSFCKKHEDDVTVMIQGGYDAKAYICNFCVIKFKKLMDRVKK